MLHTYILPSIRQGCAAALVLAVMFFLVEPAVSFGNQITISQSITAEVAFATNATNVTMSPALGGISGGTSLGGTQFAITSNDTAGYKVTIQATSTTGAMVGNASSTNKIPGYITAVGGVPDKTFTVTGPTAGFGYTVDASSTSDIASPFLWTSGTSCGSGSPQTLGNCWIAATSTAFTILSRTMPTFNGIPASSTIEFQVKINANPNPTIPNDTYTATTTLTALAN